MGDLTSRVIDYEMGDLDGPGCVRLFADLVRTGDAWRLQGHYGRTAQHLIDAGVIDVEGSVLVDLDDEGAW